MKTMYKCDFCGKLFDNEDEAETHENDCDKITDDVIIAAADIVYNAEYLIGAAIKQLNPCAVNVEFWKRESERANKTNCAFYVFRKRTELLRIFDRLKNGVPTGYYERKYPEIVDAICKYVKEACER